MQLAINVVDAFTDTVFKGNPAAVIITEDWLTDELMQSIALENNLSETAFLVKDKSGDNHSYQIRWFSPLTEIDFCGHATLAAAFVLFNKNLELTKIKFSAKAVGTFIVVRLNNGKIQMDFPNNCPQKVDEIPAELRAGLSIPPVEVYVNNQAYFVIYENEADVLSVRRDNEQLKALAPRDVVVTCPSTSDNRDKPNGYDFMSRYFWPANGGDEDAVTGSIHTGLAPFWANRLGKNNLIAYQASSRGGILECIVVGKRVLISGRAVQYLAGTISI